MIIRFVNESDINKIVKIHKVYLKKGLFSKFSERFLRSFYKVMLHDKGTITYVLEDNNEILGFITGSLNMSNLKVKIVQNLWFLLGIEVFVQPQVFIKVLKVNSYPSFKNIGQAEILSVVLVPKARGKGEGGKMIKQIISFFKYKGCKSIIVSVRDNMQKANKFYSKNGFKKVNQINFLGEEVNIWQFKIN